ncbi:MAG: SDR family NAD(P)-dependent oxidoreductase [Renibacterium sp.]|nr:SDR family NAD(P)-dependent oxidoreductase [Renibacterium sp.]
MAEHGAVVVTGGSNGIGYFISEQLAQAGRPVIIAARNAERAQLAMDAIRERVPGAELSFQELDLGSLASVRRAADALAGNGPLAAVVANAGVVHDHGPASTSDGFELFFGTNHLAHFALLARLFPALRATPGARMVHLGSLSHLWAKPVTGLPGERSWFSNYQNSKLAVMQFGFELDRRLRAHGIEARSVVAHPGNAPSAFTPERPGLHLREPIHPLLKAVVGNFSQGKDAGAWPAVHAAIGEDVQGGALWGPGRLFQLLGRPAPAKASAQAYDGGQATRLWQLSAELTGVDFDF